MPTVVVVQSDDLSAWIGVAGVAVGVVLGAGIDWWRSRLTRRRELRHRLLQAGSDLGAAAAAYQQTTRAAGDSKDEPAWHEAIQARLDALRAASLTINLTGDKNLEAAALQIVETAFRSPPHSAPEAFGRHLSEQAAALAAYRDAVRTARL